MISIINYFFQNVKCFEDGKKILIENKNFIYQNYNSIQSKKILYSMMIYKFGTEMECPDNLKEKARNIILYSLDTVKYTKLMLDKEIRKYLGEFEKWKINELDKILIDLAGSYINLEEMKKNILIKSQDIKTSVDEEWLENINILQNKIHIYGSKLHSTKFNSVLHNLRINICAEKEKVITNIMKNIYWDNFLNDIKNNNYEMLYNNFEEIKDILLEIKPDLDTRDILDINYLKKLIQNNVFDKEYLINYINFITEKLLLYGIPIYDNIVKETRIKLINNINENDLTPEIITETFKKLMDILQKLIIVIRIYRSKLNI